MDEAGRELDAQIAMKVMGWQPINPMHLMIDAGYRWLDANGLYVKGAIPPYSTDIAAAWQVVGQCSWWFELILNPATGWLCKWGDYEGRAMTAPLAICRAALAAVTARRAS